MGSGRDLEWFPLLCWPLPDSVEFGRWVGSRSVKRSGRDPGRVAMGRWIGSRSRRVAIGSRSFVSKASRVCHLDRVAIWLEIGSRSMLFQPFSSFVLIFFILRHMSCWVAIAVAG
ncbi:hypothetical protein L2E82_03447 [Cichorium intybus]|uniref:Uncharacterized protein n=1 Tax=Cichorium intybus TaxID=13427 RepID=A0ACB9H3V4_CICIN|nr:hypothetical protein L2E82_03447 [Cichorium intybus]